MVEELTPPNPNVTEGVEIPKEQPTPPTVDWELDDNPYKKRYGDSQSQVQPLVRTLQQFAEYDHNTKTWKPKAAPVSVQQADVDFEKALEGYDPEFVKILKGWTQKQWNEFQKQSTFITEYNSGVQSSRNKAIEEFGEEFDFAKNGKMNVASPLYRLANEIIHNKYAIFNPDGTFAKYSSSDAEYMATVEAYAILSKRSKQQAPDKGKLTAIKGQGTGSAAVKKTLTYDEYSKLSNAEKDVYDLSQMGGQR